MDKNEKQNYTGQRMLMDDVPMTPNRKLICPKCKKVVDEKDFMAHIKTHENDRKRYEGDSW